MPPNARRILPSLLALSATGLLLAACDSTDSSEGSPTDPSSASSMLVSVQTYRYTIQGQEIHVVSDDPDGEAYCRSETSSQGEVRYELVRDTNRIETLSWAIVGDTLRFPIERDTSSSFDGTAKSITGITERWLNHVRLSGTSGLSGTWRAVSFGERVVFGDTPGGNDVFDEYNRKTFALVERTLSFADGRLTNTTTSPVARWFLAQWNGDIVNPMLWSGTADSARYDIAVELLDERQVRLTGRKSAEIVTIGWSLDQQVYTSSVATHPAHVYYRDPSSCPNASKPVWWQDFLAANERSGMLVTWGVAPFGSAPQARKPGRPLHRGVAGPSASFW